MAINPEFGRLVTGDDDNESTESPSQNASDWLGTDESINPESIEDILAQQTHGAQSMPTPQDMASTNASNAEARAKAIADGLDEGTANILYPEFSTAEDMLKIN